MSKFFASVVNWKNERKIKRIARKNEKSNIKLAKLK